ncbi:hypothetical protein DMB42_11740 [Nonomuraea sp. WAC 01424]|uniref:hypothetical protein n=1 Tax=Nonomuraea sp. WAC 01424 TaxID=2203200 RepID=UPI000F795AC0|nr:hypothetical protein [Nonomuraea sp. WAC 01424]RSN12843.1 hypothetical protein DMB42_11740 [Nonomuraea sp. WAC 01424]
MADTSEKNAVGCSVQLVDLLGMPYCQEPVTVTYVTGCVSEHLDDDRFCGRHARLLHEGDLLCIPCHQLGHRTPAVALAELLPSGERVRVAGAPRTWMPALTSQRCLRRA